MAASNKEPFRVKSELAVFEVLQKQGKLSIDEISKITNIPSTTVQYALSRLKKRGFFSIHALPKWEVFRHKIPTLVIGFSGVSPIIIEEIKKHSIEEIRLMVHGERDLMMVVATSSEEALARMTKKLIDKCKKDPCIFMRDPNYPCFRPSFPETVLEQVFADLPDRRIKLK
jgi:DNA-binding Lrp family transcriptional regulator